MSDLYRVRADVAGHVKYWTGELRGRWPIYLNDPALAWCCSRRLAEHYAGAFALIAPKITWSIESSTPDQEP